ncbi:C-type lectin domain family 10 member A-like [Mya arenaria]|uniref:C-type lectin domain family 10 member A-like n=1 Tax=Mya arenaria TaxID=6604 RepID=UPI0022E32D3F|nr:C-type lectin domain family 10 member A-like [Mya arenaria]
MINHALVWSCIIVVITGSEPCADLDPMGCANNLNLCEDPVLAQDVCARTCNLCRIQTTQTTVSTETNTITPGTTTQFGQVIDGRWSEWSAPGSCSSTCGLGAVTKRHRTCTNPSPANGGNICKGPILKFDNCPFVKCPDAYTDGIWTDWSGWWGCLGQCGQALRYRFRHCVTSVNNGTCVGERIGSTPCSDPCIVIHTTLPSPTTTPVLLTTTTSRATTTSTTHAESTLCPAFWSRRDNSCYYFSPVTQSWDAAKTHCNSRGADLVKIDDKAEQHFLVAKMFGMGIDLWWTGGRDKGHTHYAWEWEGKDIPFTYTEWAFAEMYILDKECVAISSQYAFKWVCEKCSAAMNWICEKELDHSASLVG